MFTLVDIIFLTASKDSTSYTYIQKRRQHASLVRTFPSFRRTQFDIGSADQRQLGVEIVSLERA